MCIRDRGSGRSVEGFSLFEAVCACKGFLTKFGGHPMAAGISLCTEAVPAFRRAINAYAAGQPRALPSLTVDCVLNPQDLGLEIPRALRLLEPFGEGNPQPLIGVLNKMCIRDSLLIFQHLADPGEPLLQRVAPRDAELIFPVGGNAVFGGVVHLPGTDPVSYTHLR